MAEKENELLGTWEAEKHTWKLFRDWEQREIGSRAVPLSLIGIDGGNVRRIEAFLVGREGSAGGWDYRVDPDEVVAAAPDSVRKIVRRILNAAAGSLRA